MIKDENCSLETAINMSGGLENYKTTGGRHGNPRPNPYSLEDPKNPWESPKSIPSYVPNYQFSTLNSPPLRQTQPNLHISDNPYQTADYQSDQLYHTSSSNKYRSQEIRDQLENEIKRLDKNFAFTYNEEISLMQSAKYIKQAVDKIVNERASLSSHANRLQQSKASHYSCESCRNGPSAIEELKISLESQNKQFAAEMEKIKKTQCQLKRYESILRQKEKNLKDQEGHVNHEKSLIDKERDQFIIERENLLKERAENAKIVETINEEKLKLAKQMQTLDHKFIEIKAALSEMQKEPVQDNSAKEYEEFEQQKLEFLMECEEKADLITRAEESLNEKEKVLEEQQEELNHFSTSLNILKSEMEKQQEAQSQHLEKQSKNLQIEAKSLESKRKDIESTFKKLNDEIERVEIMKKALEDQRNLTDTEGDKMQELYVAKLNEAIIMNEEAQENMKLLTEKEVYIEEIISKIKEEEKELEER